MSPTHTVADYIGQAAHNAGLARYLRDEKPDYLDWAATCLFYSAVHYINAYLTNSKTTIPRRHRSEPGQPPGRLNIVQQDSTLQPIYASYRTLDDESRDARYELRRPSQRDYDTYLLPRLKRIQDYILPKITA